MRELSRTDSALDEIFEKFPTSDRSENTSNRPITDEYDVGTGKSRQVVKSPSLQVGVSIVDDASISALIRGARSRARCDRELSRLRARALRDDAALLAYADALATLAKAGAR
jgi:hypothetical protein